MPLYPVLNPVPDNISNPLILTLPPSNSTTTGHTMDTPLLQNILYPLIELGAGAAVDISQTHIRCLDGTLGWYDNYVSPNESVVESDRNTIREELTVTLAGTAQAAAPCCLATSTGAGGMPGYAEETSWGIFTTADNGEDASANMTAGGYTALPGHFAWLAQVFDHAWKQTIAAGVLPSGSAYIVRATADAPPSAPWGYFELYGLDPVDAPDSITAAAAYLFSKLASALANCAVYAP